MAVIDTTRPHAAGLRGLLSQLSLALFAWKDARATRAALSRLSDRELEDIGITRGDIDRVARSV